LGDLLLGPSAADQAQHLDHRKSTGVHDVLRQDKKWAGRESNPQSFRGGFTDSGLGFVFKTARADRKRNGLKTVGVALTTAASSLDQRLREIKFFDYHPCSTR
jgi:hypothetical protein